MLVILGVGGDCIAIEFIADLIQLSEQGLLEFDETRMAEQVDVVVLIALGKAISGCFCVYSRHDCWSDDWNSKLAQALLVLVEEL